MHDYEEGMTQCQNEIRRLHGVCREKNDKITRLSSLLYKAIVYIAETTEGFKYCECEEQLDLLREAFGITKYELSQIGIDWFDDLENQED